MQIKSYRFTCIKLATDHECTVNLKKIDQVVSKLEHQLGLAEMHLGLALGYVPEVLEGCRSTWSKALPISTGLYSLVKVRQVEVAFSEQKVVKMCGFRNPCPKRANPWWELGQHFGPLFRALQAPTCLPPAEGACLPAGQPSAPLVGVDFPLKNKVEGLSPSTPQIDKEVWPHLRTTLGFAPPSPLRAGRYPPKFGLLHQN